MFRLLVSLIVLIVTLIVIVVEPKMHKPVMIGSKAVLSEKSSFQAQDIKFAPQKIETKTEPIKIKTVENTSVKNLDVSREEYMKNIRLRAQKETPVEAEPQTVVETPIPAMTPKPKKVQKPKAPAKEPPQNLMQQINEKIVWNKWRADICNTIADNSLETQVYRLKKGVLFKYSFNVDKNRHISNLEVRLARGAYDEVVQDSILDINKTIRSLEGKRILEFPAGTRRTSVQVTGGIEMSDFDANLNPGNFSDIESVRY